MQTFSVDLIWFCHDFSLQMSQRRNGSKMPVVLSWFREWMGRSLCQGRCWQKMRFPLQLSHYLFMKYESPISFPIILWFQGSGRFWVQECGREGADRTVGVPWTGVLYQGKKKQRPCFRTLINLEIILVSFTSSRSSPKPCFCGCSSAHQLIIELDRKY